MPSALPPGSARPWMNWTRNLVHVPSPPGASYMFAPRNLAELRAVIAAANAAGVGVRVSGQRHSQPPLVINDNRGGLEPKPQVYLVDLSCYADLGDDGAQRMVLDATGARLTVNAGVREDEIDAFLGAHDRMLRTVTAGGFFSVGGMTAVDVHGATVDAPIFAETASAFTLVGPDGAVTTIDATTPKIGDWSPLQFARVSLGGLGVVTSVTLDVLPRPYANTLAPGNEAWHIDDEATFISTYKQVVKHNRVESFYNPYADGALDKAFLALWWDVDPNPTPPVPNTQVAVTSACDLAKQQEYGAPYEGRVVEWFAEGAAEKAQYEDEPLLASVITWAAVTDVRAQVKAAAARDSDLWLGEAARVMFMSYFVELPDLDDAGLAVVWKGLQAVASRVRQPGAFHVAAPMEFRFVRGGDSALASTWSKRPDSVFVNLDLIGFVDDGPASKYPDALLQFFADVERDWVALGGFPHNGKMYGFYDPGAAAGTHTAPFNPAFLTALRARRGDRVAAYEAYRKARDPKGLFRNAWLAALLG